MFNVLQKSTVGLVIILGAVIAYRWTILSHWRRWYPWTHQR